jgi:glycosyltransferase involved in cell wall biosynthesis
MRHKKFSSGFSVLIAVYDGDNHDLFRKAINSVLSNKLKPSQVVLVVDGPIKRIKSAFIKNLAARNHFIDILFLEKNGGLANALNQGLQLIKYPWVVRADADDINMSNRFLRLAEAIEINPTLDLIGSAVLEVDKNGVKVAIKSVPLKYSDIIKWIPYRNPFNHMSVAFKLEKVLALGGYPNIFQKEDYALWILMLSRGANACNIDDILVHATAGKDMYKRRSGLKSVRAEFDLQNILLKCGFQNFLGVIFVGLARGFILVLPNAFQSFIYEKFLRKSC